MADLIIAVIYLVFGFAAGWAGKSWRTERQEWAAEEKRDAEQDQAHGFASEIQPIGGGAE